MTVTIDTPPAPYTTLMTWDISTASIPHTYALRLSLAPTGCELYTVVRLYPDTTWQYVYSASYESGIIADDETLMEVIDMMHYQALAHFTGSAQTARMYRHKLMRDRLNFLEGQSK